MVTTTPQAGLSVPRPDPLRALLAPTTWLTAAHLLLDVAVGSIYTVVLITALLCTVALLPCALLGLPVWIITAWMSRVLARLERMRYRMLLGVRIDMQPMPPGDRNPLRYAAALWRDHGVRRRGVHQLLALPLGMVTSGIVYLLLSGSVMLLAMPVLTWMLPAEGSLTYGIPLSDSGSGRALLAGLGLVLLLLAPGGAARARRA